MFERQKTCKKICTPSRCLLFQVFFFIVSITFTPSNTYGQLQEIDQLYKSKERAQKESPQTIAFVQQADSLIDDFSRLSQILLLRHGEPDLDREGARNREEAMAYVEMYDSIAVLPPAFQPVLLQKGDVATIYTSSLNRSKSTAAQLFPSHETEADEMFREFERKVMSFPNMRFSLNFWLKTSRILWFMGMNKKGIERFRDAKIRAKEGAIFLDIDARQKGKTLLVSHGLLNHYIVKYLKKQGWKEVFDGGKGYLSQKLLVKYLDLNEE